LSSSEATFDVKWLAPTYRPAPAEALDRIQQICTMQPDLFGAMWCVMATHQGVPNDILAAALKQFRRDAEVLSREDVAGLMVALTNGGRQGFDAVLRTRRNVPRSAATLPWSTD